MIYKIKYFVFFLFIFSFPAFSAQKAKIIYETYFGEYFTGSTYDIELDLSKESPASIYKKLMILNPKTESNLLLSGYGKNDDISNYFGGTKDLENNTPLNRIHVYKNLMIKNTDEMFFLRFVNPDYSSYADPNAPEHFPLSPFYHLNLIGKRVNWY